MSLNGCHYYYVEGYSGSWFVCFADSQKAARSCGVREFGRGSVVATRRATTEEIEQYCREKSIDKFRPMWNGTRVQTVEEVRQFQMKAE